MVPLKEEMDNRILEGKGKWLAGNLAIVCRFQLAASHLDGGNDNGAKSLSLSPSCPILSLPTIKIKPRATRMKAPHRNRGLQLPSSIVSTEIGQIPSPRLRVFLPGAAWVMLSKTEKLFSQSL